MKTYFDSSITGTKIRNPVVTSFLNENDKKYRLSERKINIETADRNYSGEAINLKKQFESKLSR